MSGSCILPFVSKSWLVFSLSIALFVAGCASSTPIAAATPTEAPFTRATVTVGREFTPTSPPAFPTVTKILPTSTPSPAPTLTYTPLPPTSTQLPSPTFTHTPEPTATPTLIPVPPLERVLHLASPVLQGEDVLRLQNWLQALGYTDVGTPDGIFGGKTDQAVRLFQTDQGLEVDGYVGEATWTRLFYLSEVKQLEIRLKELGYGICDANKVYSEQTTAALARFQALNGLEANGVIDPETWTLLFSGEALPISHGAALSVVQLGEMDFSGHLSFDGEALWLVGSESLLRIDSETGRVMNTISYPDLGQVKDGYGVTYPKTFSADQAMVNEDQLWVSGEVLTYPNLQASALLVFDYSGKLIRGPLFLSSNRDVLTWVPALFKFSGKIWASLDAFPNQTLYEINPLSYQVGRGIPLRDVEAVYDMESDGETIWVTMVLEGDRTVRTLNLNTGRFGPPLAACGYELAFDGKWLWVERSAIIFAIDPNTGEIVAHAHVNGTILSMTSDGEGTLWVLVSESNKWYLQVVDVR